MKAIISIISILFVSISLQAQPGGSPDERMRPGMARVHAIKMGYLTDRLHLTPVQAASFWPVYDDYEGEMRDVRQTFRQKYRSGATDNDAAANRFIDDNLDFQEQMLAINRKYKDRMLKVISPQQLATLYEAERDFKKLLLQQLRERRGMRR
jgi:hypothetical protein